MSNSDQGRRRKRRIAIKVVPAAAKRENYEEDRISEVPDDILILIISQLTLREATATSILSRRWRYLHTYTTRLDFPPFKLPQRNPHAISREENIRQEKRVPPYINMINRVVDSHKGGRIREFRAHLPCLDGADTERWLEFAFSRGVEILEMKMHCLRRYLHSPRLFNLISPLPGHLGCLRELSLSVIHVDDAEVQLLLSKFPLLESLSIENSGALRNVLIVGTSLLLKHLNISTRNLESLEIGDMINLVSLKCHFSAFPNVIRLYNVPKLIELSTTDLYDNTLTEFLPRIPLCIRDQLRRIKLSTSPDYITWGLEDFPRAYRVPELKNIKNLEMTIRLFHTYDDLCGFLPLIGACPSLEILEIEFSWILDNKEISKLQKEEEIINMRLPKQKLSQNMKKLKLSGFIGCSSELRLTLCILNNIVSLEELIVQTCDGSGRVRRIAKIRALHNFQSAILDSTSLVVI